MALFSGGIPRLFVLSAALVAVCLITPQTLAGGPDLCLWQRVFHLTACPACGSTRALAAFFHGRFAEALAFNRNVLVTAPGLLVLLALDALRWARRH